MKGRQERAQKSTEKAFLLLKVVRINEDFVFVLNWFYIGNNFQNWKGIGVCKVLAISALTNRSVQKLSERQVVVGTIWKK